MTSPRYVCWLHWFPVCWLHVFPMSVIYTCLACSPPPHTLARKHTHTNTQKCAHTRTRMHTRTQAGANTRTGFETHADWRALGCWASGCWHGLVHMPFWSVQVRRGEIEGLTPLPDGRSLVKAQVPPPPRPPPPAPRIRSCLSLVLCGGAAGVRLGCSFAPSLGCSLAPSLAKAVALSPPLTPCLTATLAGSARTLPLHALTGLLRAARGSAH